MIVTLEEWAAFEILRRKTFDLIRRALEKDGHCKSYEGRFELHFPNYFEEERGVKEVTLLLACYVLGPFRSARWIGETLGIVVAKADTDISRWGQAKDFGNDFEAEIKGRMLSE